MKLINSRKDINKLVEAENIGDFYDTIETEEEYGPCWQVSLDKDEGKMIFLVDAKEILSYPMAKLNKSCFTIGGITELISILKTGDLSLLKKELRKKK